MMTATCKEIIHQPMRLRIMAELASPPEAQVTFTN